MLRENPDRTEDVDELAESRARRLVTTVLGRRASADRLREGIHALRAEQEERDAHRAQGGAEPAAGDGRATHELVRAYLSRACAMYQEGRYDVGWGLLHRAREAEIRLLSRAELRGVAVALRAEADAEKVKGWRLEAICSLLDRMHEPPRKGRDPGRRVPGDGAAAGDGARPADGSRVVPADRPVEPAESLAHDAALLQQAVAIRNGHFANQYTGLSITSHRRLWLLVLGLGLLAAFVALILVNEDQLDATAARDDAPVDALRQAWVMGSMLLLGALGSVVSAIQRLARQPVLSSIPAQLGSFTATVTRPLIGAAAAMTVLLAALGGIAVPQDHPVPLMMLAAFTAGLSERLVVYREKSEGSTPPPV